MQPSPAGAPPRASLRRWRRHLADERLEAALTALGVEHDVRTYPDANHSFLEPMPPPLAVFGLGLHRPSAEDAWGRILRFFDKHLRETS